MRKTFIFFLVLSLYPTFTAFAQDSIPDINSFLGAEIEPDPTNMAAVRRMIRYPQTALQKGIEGNVIARVLVSPEGLYVRHAFVSDVDSILTAAVNPHVSKLQFTPAKKDGKPIYCWVNIPFNFKILNPEPVKMVKEAPTVIPDINAIILGVEEPNLTNMAAVRRMIQYPDIAQINGIEGLVLARILVSPEGDYVKHAIISEVDPVLISAVEPHISLLRFTPAIKDGKPIYYWVNIPFHFKVLEPVDILFDNELRNPTPVKMAKSNKPGQPVEEKQSVKGFGYLAIVGVILIGFAFLANKYNNL